MIHRPDLPLPFMSILARASLKLMAASSSCSRAQSTSAKRRWGLGSSVTLGKAARRHCSAIPRCSAVMLLSLSSPQFLIYCSAISHSRSGFWKFSRIAWP
eukprot:TRINITY_DN22576_c0_g1_i1.p1 TRINITY_DN22576_c0_g1~~TRINITY_DN22576_c0_g1_i1.p1  ORF type:complete len:100 (-),score=6.24 TRINITY_DN22576_c0_g1_i1:117-416(-)